MKKDTVVELKKLEKIAEDPLMEVLRKGAQQLLAKALEAEVEDFIRRFDEIRDSEGRRQVVRNGYLPERTIQTGLGDIPVKAPRVTDKSKSNKKIRFTSSILPPYLKRTKSIEELLPWLDRKSVV